MKAYHMKTEKYIFTDETGCHMNDEIIIRLSPSSVEYLTGIIESLAESSNNYYDQKNYHKYKDLFQNEIDDYKNAREEFDEEWKANNKTLDQ